MKPLDDERRVVAEWVHKAEADWKAVCRLVDDGELREVVAIHAQQAVVCS
jgi:hypothetical protein